MLVIINQVNDRATKAFNGLTAQSNTLSSVLTSLNSRINVLEANNSTIFCDFYTNYFLSLVSAETTAQVDTLFNYVTLPTHNYTSLLVQTDNFNNPVISSEIIFSYSFETNPNSANFVSSASGINMLLRKNVWTSPEARPVWVKVIMPVQYLGLNPNVIEIYPYPCFGCDISDVQVLYNSTVNNTFTAVDVSYVSNYDSGTGKIVNAGPIKIFVDEKFTQVLFKLTPHTDVTPALYDFKIASESFETSAFVTIRDPYTRNISGVTVYGKNPSSLATLPNNGTGDKVTISLSTTDPFVTPVINGVITTVS